MRKVTQRILRDYSLTIFLAVTLSLGIRILFIEAYRIPGPAMRPTLEPGDTIFVSKWAYGLRLPFFSKPVTAGEKPRHGDVVVFASPAPGGGDYIKRVIGTPGDTVAVKKGQVFVNGKSLSPATRDEKACGPEISLSGRSYDVCAEPPLPEDVAPQKVPENAVFVLGDLRSSPPEIRKQKIPHLIPVSLIKGKAMWVWLSIEPGESTAGVFPKLRFERMFRRIQ